LGLGKYFYTRKNEGHRLSVAEEQFFGLRTPEPEKAKKPKKEKIKKPDVPTDIASILDGLL